MIKTAKLTCQVERNSRGYLTISYNIDVVTYGNKFEVTFPKNLGDCLTINPAVLSLLTARKLYVCW